MGEGEDEQHSSHGAEHRCFPWRCLLRYRTALYALLSRGGLLFHGDDAEASSLGKMDQMATPRGIYLGLGGTLGSGASTRSNSATTRHGVEFGCRGVATRRLHFAVAWVRLASVIGLDYLSRGYWRFVRKHHPSLGAAPRPRRAAVVAGSRPALPGLHTINASGGLVPVRG